tara:strand:- start:306 stop:809 length:504 start_codon:yes stop_codon:yes gene_type:complete
MKLIVAVDLDNGIGKNNIIPWYYPEDFRFFKKITCQTFLPDKRNAIIMGRMTWQSLSKDFLPNRLNIVITRDTNKYKDKEKKNLKFVNSLDQAIDLVEQDKQIETKWIIGGAEIYHQAFDRSELTDVYLTRIKENYNCDKKINLPNMKLINNTDYDKYSMNHYKISK